MIAQDAARIILGAWIRGEHREDMNQIPAGDFGLELMPIANVLQSGETDALTIARKAEVSPAVISELANATSYEELYRSAMRQIIRGNIHKWIEEHRNADPEEIMAYLEKNHREWMAEAPDLPDLNEIIVDYYNVLDERKREKTLHTGIIELDELTNGIHKGDLTAVGARPSTGKSSFALQVATNVAAKGGVVLFFSLEMTNDQNMDRIVMRYVEGVSQKTLRSGDLEGDEWDRVSKATESLEQLNGHLMFSQERNLTMIEQIIAANKPDLVVIDQLTQLTDSGRFTDVRSRFSHMTSNLKRIAMEYNTAIWLCCQLNRQVNGSTKPSMDYLKESGSIEEDSDNVILLSRDEDEEEARGVRGNRIINVNLAKQRSGPTGEFLTMFFVQRFLFSSLEKYPTGFEETQEEVSF